MRYSIAVRTVRNRNPVPMEANRPPHLLFVLRRRAIYDLSNNTSRIDSP
jgi:hypothetical protein